MCFQTPHLRLESSSVQIDAAGVIDMSDRAPYTTRSGVDTPAGSMMGYLLK